MNRILLALIFLLGIFGQNAFGEDTIKIAGMFGLTGDSASFGKGELDAVTLAIEETNQKGGVSGHKLELQAEDTASKPLNVVSAYKKLVDIDKQSVIIGPTWLDTYQGVLPLAERAKVLLLTPSAEARAIKHTDPKDIYALSVYYSSTAEVRALLSALKKKGKTRVIGTYTNEPYFLLIRQIVEEEVAKFGIELLENQNFDIDFADFKSFMAKSRAKSPDVLLGFQMGELSMRNLLKERNTYLPGTVVVGVHDLEGFLESEDFKKSAVPAYFSAFVRSDTGFAARFKKRFGYEPILTHSNAYDAANMVIEALKAGKRTGIEVRDYLMTHRFKTVTFGEVGFLPNGGLDSGGKIEVKELTSSGINSIL